MVVIKKGGDRGEYGRGVVTVRERGGLRVRGVFARKERGGEGVHRRGASVVIMGEGVGYRCVCQEGYREGESWNGCNCGQCGRRGFGGLGG